MLVLIFSHAVWAETKYVVEHLQINVRAEGNAESKIVGTLQSGQKVELLEVQREWSRVKLANGREGWILSRFLTGSEPRRLVLERLQAKYNELNDQMAILSDENNFLKDENQILKSELAINKDALNTININYEELKQASSELLNLKASEQEARLKVQELTSKVENLEEEASGLRNQQNIRWFLSGAGVLFLGFLTGSISKRKRRRSSLL